MPDTTNKPNKHNSILMSVVSLALSTLFAISLIFAWFSFNINPNLSGVKMRLKDAEHNGYALWTLDLQSVPDDGFLIYPGDTLKLEIMTIIDTEDFGIRLESLPLSDTDFTKQFKERDDLLMGMYQKVQTLTGAGDTEVKKEQVFDIDDYLKSNVGGSETVINGHKLDFLQKFTKNNTIHDALTVKIAKIENMETHEFVEPAGGPIELFRDETKGEYSDIYYAPEGTQIAMQMFQMFQLEISYGLNGFKPYMEYTDSQGVFETGEYYALNYNCFIGESLLLSFENIRYY